MSLNLQVEIDQRSGFCFGVRKAVEKAEHALQAGEKLYCLGHIVHNGAEVERLEKLGMVTITHDQLEQLSGATVLIRAHGEPPETYARLKDRNIKVIEATCPVVLKLQDRIRKSHSNDDFVLIYGKRNHPEVKGLAGQIPSNIQVIEHIDELETLELPNRLALYSQTTKELNSFYAIEKELTHRGIEVELNDTVCRQVSGRKEKLQVLAQKVDVMIMVAGVDSSNGKVLYQNCLEVNSRTYSVAKLADLDPSWFQPEDRVGVAGATSTPQWLMDSIAQEIKSF